MSNEYTCIKDLKSTNSGTYKIAKIHKWQNFMTKNISEFKVSCSVWLDVVIVE